MSLEETQKLGVEMLSLKVNFGAQQFADKRTITNEEFYQKLAASATVPTTSLVNANEFVEVFERYPDDDLVVLTLSSALSGTYQSAVVAKSIVARENIYPVDTQTVTIGLGLLVKYAVKLRAEGLSGGQIAQQIAQVTKNVRILGIIDTLKYLVKGGRLSGAQGIIGSVLGLKPLICVEDGEVHNIGKTRSMKAAISEVVHKMKTVYPMDERMPCSFGHTNNESALRMLMEALGQSGNPDKYLIGSVVGTHAGPGAIAVSFFQRV
jgi:DegV family protein with EDD domain